MVRVRLILSPPVAGLGAVFGSVARTTQPINDISTDTNDLPALGFTATQSVDPAGYAEPQSAAYPDVRPLELLTSVDEAFAAALALMEERGWEVLSS